VTDAHRAVERLLFAYADAVDAGDLAAVGALFAVGRVCGETADGPVTLAEGSAAVEAFYRSMVRLYDDGTPRTRHVTTNVTVEVDDAAGTASASSTYTVLQATEVLALQPIIVGRYRDTFRRHEGEWSFESRTMRADLTGDLSQHLLG
jgi:3-phenylpropionate/cinnamic acid dioxygenase small subunit